MYAYTSLNRFRIAHTEQGSIYFWFAYLYRYVHPPPIFISNLLISCQWVLHFIWAHNTTSTQDTVIFVCASI